jgi:hypothetical protein
MKAPWMIFAVNNNGFKFERKFELLSYQAANMPTLTTPERLKKQGVPITLRPTRLFQY